MSAAGEFIPGIDRTCTGILVGEHTMKTSIAVLKTLLAAAAPERLQLWTAACGDTRVSRKDLGTIKRLA
jgi:hypothetical protein